VHVYARIHRFLSLSLSDPLIRRIPLSFPFIFADAREFIISLQFIITRRDHHRDASTVTR